MTMEPIPEPEGPEDDRFVYVVTAAGAEALARESPASGRSKPPSPAASAGGDRGGLGAHRGRDAGSG